PVHDSKYGANTCAGNGVPVAACAGPTVASSPRAPTTATLKPTVPITRNRRIRTCFPRRARRGRRRRAASVRTLNSRHATYFDAFAGVKWSVTASGAGTATLTIRYANGTTANRPMDVAVNGRVVAAGRAFPPTGSWSTWQAV